MKEWINVDEQLPHFNDYYIVFVNGRVLLAYYSSDDYWHYGYYSNRIYPTHWMPLPEPPK